MLEICLTSPALARPGHQTSASVQDDIYGAEIYGEAVPQYERPAPSAVEEPELPAYEPLYSVKQVSKVLYRGWEAPALCRHVFGLLTCKRRLNAIVRVFQENPASASEDGEVEELRQQLSESAAREADLEVTLVHCEARAALCSQT